MYTHSHSYPYDDSLPDQKTPRQLFWLNFHDRYKKPAERVEGLYKIINDVEPITCQRCGSQEIERAYGQRRCRCKQCGKKSSFTVGTFFQRCKHITAWLAAAQLTDLGLTTNQCELARETGASDSTTWAILRKIEDLQNRFLKTHPGATELDSALFTGIFYRRSLETPANRHPVEEQTEMEKREFVEALADETPGQKPSHSHHSPGQQTTMQDITKTEAPREYSESETEVLKYISTERITFDELCRFTGLATAKIQCALTMLELDELIKIEGNVIVSQNPTPITKAKPGQGAQNPLPIHKKSTANSHKIPKKKIDSILSFIYDNFQAISRKYLQLYLAAYWCQVDRTTWSPGSFYKACRHTDAKTYKQIKSFVSPLVVQVAPL